MAVVLHCSSEACSQEPSGVVEWRTDGEDRDNVYNETLARIAIDKRKERPCSRRVT